MTQVTFKAITLDPIQNQGLRISRPCISRPYCTDLGKLVKITFCKLIFVSLHQSVTKNQLQNMNYLFILFMLSQYEVDLLLQQNSKQTNFVLRILFLFTSSCNKRDKISLLKTIIMQLQEGYSSIVGKRPAAIWSGWCNIAVM